MAYAPSVERWRSQLAGLFPASEVDKLLWVIQHESGGRPEAIGDSGASYGLFQSQSPRGSVSTPEQQIQDAYRRWTARGYKDWGENSSYQGKKFGALGNYPYPGGPSTASGRSGGPAPYVPSFDPAQVETLKQAVLGAKNIQTPASPIGGPPELAQLYQSSFQLPQAQIAAGALGNIGEEEIRKRKEAEAEAEREAEKLREDFSDFSKYQKVHKEDGGYDFFDPAGNQVDIATLSQRTGVRPAEVVKDSTNTNDLQFLRDYNRLVDFKVTMADAAKGDVDSQLRLTNLIADNKDLEAFKKSNRPISDLDKLFHQKYKYYYVPASQARRIGGWLPGSPLFGNPEGLFTGSTSVGGGVRSW